MYVLVLMADQRGGHPWKQSYLRLEDTDVGAENGTLAPRKAAMHRTAEDF